MSDSAFPSHGHHNLSAMEIPGSSLGTGLDCEPKRDVASSVKFKDSAHSASPAILSRSFDSDLDSKSAIDVPKQITLKVAESTLISAGECPSSLDKQVLTAVTTNSALASSASRAIASVRGPYASTDPSNGSTTPISVNDPLLTPSATAGTSGSASLPHVFNVNNAVSYDDGEMTESLKQAYIFLSECNRQELRKIARRWNCPQGFTKGVLVAKLAMFVFEQVEKHKICGLADILGAADEWGFDGFLAQWSTVHSLKPFPDLSTLQKLSRFTSKTDADAAPELSTLCGKRKWRKTRMREREKALHGLPGGDAQSDRVPKCATGDQRKDRENPKLRKALDAGNSTVLTGTGRARITRQSGTSSGVGTYAVQNGTNATIDGCRDGSGKGTRKRRNIGNGDPETKMFDEFPSLSNACLDERSADVNADVSAFDTMRNKLEQFSDQMMRMMKVQMEDDRCRRGIPTRGRGSVAVKAENGVLARDDNSLSRVDLDADLETERKLLLELKQAKKEMETAKGDAELEARWKAFADRIRKKLDALGRMRAGSI